MTLRHFRTTREAFPIERAPATFGPYRQEPGPIGRALRWFALLALFAAIGALIGLGFKGTP